MANRTLPDLTSDGTPETTLLAIPPRTPKDAFMEVLREELDQDQHWRAITKDRPAYLRGQSVEKLNLLERERLGRSVLAERLLYNLHRLGLSEIDTEDAVFTSWALVTAVGGRRGQVQDAYRDCLDDGSSRPKLRAETKHLLEQWRHWELGARRTSYGCKAEARKSLHRFMQGREAEEKATGSQEKLIDSHFLGDVISDHFFPTAVTHRMRKAREEWRLILAGRHLLEVIGRTQVLRARRGRGRWFHYLDLLTLDGPQLRDAIDVFREAIGDKAKSSRTLRRDYRIILDRWVDESDVAVYEQRYLDNSDRLWQSRPMEDDFEDAASGDTEESLWYTDRMVAKLNQELVPKAFDGDMRRIEHVIRLAQRHTPEDKRAFVLGMNQVLDALSLRVRTQDGTLHRLALKVSAEGKGCIQLSGKGSGKTCGFKRAKSLTVVPVATSYIGAQAQIDGPER